MGGVGVDGTARSRGGGGGPSEHQGAEGVAALDGRVGELEARPQEQLRATGDRHTSSVLHTVRDMVCNEGVKYMYMYMYMYLTDF